MGYGKIAILPIISIVIFTVILTFGAVSLHEYKSEPEVYKKYHYIFKIVFYSFALIYGFIFVAFGAVFAPKNKNKVALVLYFIGSIITIQLETPLHMRDWSFESISTGFLLPHYGGWLGLLIVFITSRKKNHNCF